MTGIIWTNYGATVNIWLKKSGQTFVGLEIPGQSMMLLELSLEKLWCGLRYLEKLWCGWNYSDSTWTNNSSYLASSVTCIPLVLVAHNQYWQRALAHMVLLTSSSAAGWAKPYFALQPTTNHSPPPYLPEEFISALLPGPLQVGWDLPLKCISFRVDYHRQLQACG